MSSELPKDWPVVAIGSLTRVKRGASPRPIQDPKWFSDEGHGWVRISDVTASDRVLLRTTQYLSEAGREASVEIVPGDLIMSICGTIGRPLFSGIHACIHDGFVAFKEIDTSRLDPNYLYFVLQAQTRHFEAQSQPGTQRNLNSALVGKTEIPLPPLDEQRRIAEVLRSVDEAIEAADYALSQTKLVRQKALDELLSPVCGQTRSDRVSCRLGDVLSIAHGFAFKSEHFTANRSDPILLTPGNFSVEKTLYFGDRTKHYSGPIPDGYILDDGDLVVVMTDLTQDMAILGNAVEISGDSVVLHNQRIGRVSVSRPDLIVKGFARLLLNSTAVQSRVKATASGSTVRHTAPSRILECEVQLPTLDEQARIVAIARSLDDIVDAEQRRRADDAVTGPLFHLRSLKALIASDLLSGRVRVPA